MKSIGELTELEAMNLRRAQAELKDAAAAFVTARVSGQWPLHSLNNLFRAAREFDRVCNDSGLDEYWKAETFEVINVPPSGWLDQSPNLKDDIQFE